MKMIISLLGLVSLILANVQERPPVPSLGGDQGAKQFPCKVPEFLVQLPPQMEGDYKECINKRFEPTKTLVEVVLKQQVSKKAVLIDFHPSEHFFTKVYKVNYKIDDVTSAMLCNETMTYCVADKPIVNKKR